MKSTKKSLFSYILVIGLWFMGSCQKDMDEFQNTDRGNYAGLACFNGLSMSNSLNMKIDEKFYSSEIDDFPAGSYIPYRTIFPGVRTISLQAKYANSFLFKGPMSFEANKLYSIFFYGANQAKYLLSQDDLSFPKENECKIRIVNLIEEKGLKLSISNAVKTESQSLNVEVTDFKTEALGTLTFSTSLINEELPELNFTLSPLNKGIYTICLYVQTNPINQQKTYKYEVIKY
ncbi:hypothetical protein ACFRAE_03555 [Sphingobacterium sp. HJSM2_6]|uniref:hypothetical protein n=1 Tax=Sphingobacterium sp. HJSM2_6 TaxID=3366264 RepID=UPI003BE9377D